MTRGDGHEGIIVNKQRPSILDLPKDINTDLPYLEIRGELYLKL